ncbi:MAG: alpha/beta hydrolase family protein, partial [Clostridia bacterium]
MEPIHFGERLAGFYDVSFQETEYIRSLANDYFMKEAEEKKNLRTKEDVIARRKKIQAAFKQAVGVLPDRYAPLNVEYCNEQVLAEGITLKNLTFDSVPGLKVTASLWLPTDYDNGEKYPAVMVAVGHSPIGRAHNTYVMLCRMLARNGMVVISCDPPGQFERVQYPGEDGKSRIGGAVAEHFQVGFPCHLTGLTFAAFFARDLERGLDVLEGLPFVDTARIAIAGNSGGGMMSAFMALWDDRLAAAAPACFITSRQAALLTGRPQDPEQIIPRVMEEGINHDDFVALFAPKPHLICAADYDGVDVCGAVFTHERAKAVYRLFDAEKNARYYSAPTGHGLYEGQRKKITEFLSEVLDARLKTVADVNPQVVPPEQLMATKTGCLLTDDPKAKTIYDCYKEYYKTNGYTDCDRKELRQRALKLLRVPCDMENRPPIRYPRFISDDIIDGIRVR